MKNRPPKNSTHPNVLIFSFFLPKNLFLGGGCCQPERAQILTQRERERERESRERVR